MSKRLAFPPRICLLDGGQLAAYGTAKGQVHELAQLPPKGTAGQALSPRRLVASAKTGACLVFFLVTSAAGTCPGTPALAPCAVCSACRAAQHLGLTQFHD